MAETHLEVYRPFEGTLQEHRFRAWPIWITGLQTALKQRRALLILYLPPLIGTVIFSFIVYTVLSASEQLESGGGLKADGLQEQIAKEMVNSLITRVTEVANWIIEFHKGLSFFALLAVAWFGSGLFCEDRKAGAHQLYFARPITRLDYFLGKFSIAATFALLTTLVPPLVICTIASLASTDWDFLKEKWDLIPRSIAFSLLWTTVVTTLVLLASALATRRSFALIGVVGTFMITGVMGKALGHLADRRLFCVSLGEDLETLSYHVLGRAGIPTDVHPGEAWVAVGAFVAVALLVIAARLRRLEVVA